MGTKDHHHHKVSSFNPAWCLRPPPTKPTTPYSSNNGNNSPLPSAYRPKKSHRRRSHHNPELTVEPTSPRVGCMGQIRRCKAPSAATPSVHPSSASSSRSPSASPQFNLLMLKRGASGSSLNTSSLSSGSSTASPAIITGEFSLLMLKRLPSTKVSLEGMDPPRPVQRKEAKPENSVSLWKRRCGGRGGGLQVQLQAKEQISV